MIVQDTRTPKQHVEDLRRSQSTPHQRSVIKHVEELEREIERLQIALRSCGSILWMARAHVTSAGGESTPEWVEYWVAESNFQHVLDSLPSSGLVQIAKTKPRLVPG